MGYEEWKRQRQMEEAAWSVAAFVLRKAQKSAQMAIIETACAIAASQLGTTRRLLTLKQSGVKNARP